LPDYPTRKRTIAAGSVRGILYFEPDWSPHFLEIKGIDRSTKPWIRAFKTTLEPVFKQLGVGGEDTETSFVQGSAARRVEPDRGHYRTFFGWANN
jgi:hypothetical protein